MPNKMLIDASHKEETRVVVMRGNRIEEFDFESQDRKQLKGNIYLARVTRVEPSLQAAFVEYGGNRHGFLAFSEIHPDYYQIPVADRQALLKADAEEAEAQREEEEEAEARGGRRRVRQRGRAATRTATASGNGEDSEYASEPAREMAADAPADAVSEPAIFESDNNGGSPEADGRDSEVESVGAEDAIEEARRALRRPLRRNYKIQEVIKRRQILLVQVVKEERGNKGAALTTYLSLAGRYAVLMPNTARGGGISRKITNAQDRKRLKDIVRELEVPEGMGVILRTAGENRTKAEIKRDFEYLLRLWENVRNLTLQSTAPALVYEEGSLIKRSVRDLYNKDIDEILVAGEEGYREAKDFMRMLMPSHAKVVQPYRDTVPLFVRYGVEAQLDRMLQPQVTLKSGGYIIINQTEALVSIDVNSGRSTKEHSIEETALQTNLEAAEEIARQLRLRDLAGLIVIDFIDMEESRNNRAVEKRLKEYLKNDRARIQVGRISPFGLLEMSRQRIRTSVLESTMKPCPHCGGTGHVRSDSSVALHVVRGIEEYLLKDNRHNITVRTPVATALYVLNNKRATLLDLEQRFGVSISVEVDEMLAGQHFLISRGTAVENPVLLPAITVEAALEEEDEVVEVEAAEAEELQTADAREDGEPDGGRRRRRRRRRRGRDREQHQETTSSDAEAGTAPEPADASFEEEHEQTGVKAEGERKKRRRGRRGGRRNRREGEPQPSAAEAASETQETAVKVSEPEAAGEKTPSWALETAEDAAPVAMTSTPPGSDEPAASGPAAKPRRRRARSPETEAEAAEKADEATSEKPRRTRRKAAASHANQAEEVTAPAEPAEGTSVESTEPITNPRSNGAGEEKRIATEPVVTTIAVTPEGEDPLKEPKPKRAGWWQRKGFF
jgi:ribonuclease E